MFQKFNKSKFIKNILIRLCFINVPIPYSKLKHFIVNPFLSVIIIKTQSV